MFEPFIYDRYAPSAHQILNIIGKEPDCVIIAGSGFNAAIPRENITASIHYSKIAGFPVSSVLGHHSELLFGEIAGKNVMIFAGRFHIYEGRSIDEICSPVIIGVLAGAKSFLLTNAAGGLTMNAQSGSLMLISDVIDLTARNINPVLNKEYLALNRLNKSLFDSGWSMRLKSSLTENHVHFLEGTYAGVTGPNYETRAEIRMLRKIGATAVGMSTIHEAKLLSILGVRTVACSLITNNAKEITQSAVTHEEVLSTAKSSIENVGKMIESAVLTTS